MSSSAPQWQSAGMTGRMHQQFGFAPPAPQGAATGGNFDAFVSQQQQQQMAAAAAAAVQYGQLAAGFAQQQQQQQQQQQRRRDEERE
jgi:ribosomal protein L12E/L44/L45/RPP1/RPP2